MDSSDTPPPSVLVAEDEEVSRSLMSEVLAAAGYSVLAVENGAAALDAVKSQRVDLAVVDQMMEPMGGLAFAQAMRGESIRLPVIMVTAHDVSDLLVVAWKAGISSVLKKPLDPDRLVEAVERALRWRGGR